MRTPWLLVALAAALAPAAHGAEQGPPPTPKPRLMQPRAAHAPVSLVVRLGDPSATVRDQALEALVALGDEAVPVLTRALEHTDPEVAWRARAALHRIRWRIGPKLAARIADLMDGFGAQPRGRRELVCRDLAMVGLSDAVPTLQQILKADPSKAVRHAAARALVVLGDEGLAALLAAGVKTDGLNVYTVSVRIHLGNSHLERGHLEKALEQYRLGLEADPKNSIAHYNIACTYARMNKATLALDALERAVAHGYRDAEWMAKDSDLESLHDEPRFKALHQKLRDKNRAGE